MIQENFPAVTETELEAKAVAPRVTEQSINEKIAQVRFIKATDVLTLAILTMQNGFFVTGESACASPENYNQEIGERLAYQMAFKKLWSLEGYLLKQRLFEEAQTAQLIMNSKPEDAAPF